MELVPNPKMDAVPQLPAFDGVVKEATFGELISCITEQTKEVVASTDREVEEPMAETEELVTDFEKDAVPQLSKSDSVDEEAPLYYEIGSSGETVLYRKEVVCVMQPVHHDDAEPESEPDEQDSDYVVSADEDGYSEGSQCQSDSNITPPSSPLCGNEDSKLPTGEISAIQSEPKTPVQEFMSKNGQITWYDHPTRQLNDETSPIKQSTKVCTPGPTKMALKCGDDVISIFKLFLTDVITTQILRMTNLEGKRLVKQWKDMDEITLNAFIGLLLLAGVFRSKGEATLSLWEKETGRAIFPATMSLKRFCDISRSLCFNKQILTKTKEKTDKLAPIRDVWDLWVARLPLMYNPGRNVTVDERLVPYRGRCPMKQYIPSKPGKYGIKVWAACDAKTSYAFNMQVYTGKSKAGPAEKGQGKRVVLDMVKGLKGHIITMDNFFTSYSLAEELLKQNITMLGTVRKNKSELPQHLFTDVRKREPHTSVFLFSDKATLVSYCPRKYKDVVLLSTEHKDGALSDREDRKPMMIMDYNATKGGVDNLDKCAGAYSCQRTTHRWPMAVFFNILDVSAYNAFVIWNHHPRKDRAIRRNFLEKLGWELVSPYIRQREILPRCSIARNVIEKIQGVVPSPIPSPQKGAKRKRDLQPASQAHRSKRSRCKDCSRTSAVDRKTQITCTMCEKYICTSHMYKICELCCPDYQSVDHDSPVKPS